MTDKPYLCYFDGISAKSYFQSKDHNVTCRHPLCNKKPTHKCKKNFCAWKFCSKHFDHMHHACRYKGCNDYATTWSNSANVECCNEHYYRYESSYATAQYYANAPRCKTCDSILNGNRISIGYCGSCNGMWRSLRKQGFGGPFG